MIMTILPSYSLTDCNFQAALVVLFTFDFFDFGLLTFTIRVMVSSIEAFQAALHTYEYLSLHKIREKINWHLTFQEK